MQADCGVVIVAAGSGTRMADGGPPKQFRCLLGRPVFLWSALFFAQQESVYEIVIVCAASEMELVERLCREHKLAKPTRIVKGGARRQDSVAAGVAALSEQSCIVAIHDAARPFPPADLNQAVQTARDTGSAVYASPVVDTLKRAKDRLVVETVPRENLWGAQTPQIFQRSLLEQAQAFCVSHGLEVSDDASAVEAMGKAVYLFAGSRTNLKITTPQDWPLAEAIANVLSKGA